MRRGRRAGRPDVAATRAGRQWPPDLLRAGSRGRPKLTPPDDPTAWVRLHCTPNVDRPLVFSTCRQERDATAVTRTASTSGAAVSHAADPFASRHARARESIHETRALEPRRRWHSRFRRRGGDLAESFSARRWSSKRELRETSRRRLPASRALAHTARSDGVPSVVLGSLAASCTRRYRPEW